MLFAGTLVSIIGIIFKARRLLKVSWYTQSKDAAIKYKMFLDEIGIVSNELLISPPDEREGEDSAYGESTDRVKQFWKKMMEEHGTAKRYENNIINRFKKSDKTGNNYCGGQTANRF